MTNHPKFKNMSVLVADDVFKMRNLIKVMLRQMGFSTFFEAGDGLEAVQILSRQNVDLILCDWNMPKMKGIDVLKFVRSNPNLEQLPFIMITGEMTEAVVAEAAETEVDDYVVKPFTLEHLKNKLTRVVDIHGEVRQIEEHLGRGRAYIATKQFAEAKNEFKAALAVNPKSPRTLLEIGRLYEQTGNDVQAKAYYQRAVDLSPKFVKAIDALANLCFTLGDIQGQATLLEQAIKISPRNLERRFMLGQSFIKSGRSDDAKALFGRILSEATKQYADIVERVGDALLELEAYDEAEKAYQKALDSNPDSLHTYNQLGIAFRKQGKTEEAIANYLRALAISPQDENLHYNLARAYSEGKHLDQARNTLEKALKINPHFREAKELLQAIRG
ncbi:MAG: tetratricopeptide repeat protein [Deltaproteobacteria bacterium]|nr:tetratricopeptide repeat protein [Deltaproteobacteria bacterium]